MEDYNKCELCEYCGCDGSCQRGECVVSEQNVDLKGEKYVI